VRWPRLFGSVRFWVALCIAVRLGALAIMPLKSGAFLNRAMPETNRASASYLEFLQHRTEFNPLTEDEHCYDDMATSIRRGRGFVVDYVWVITTPGQPAMYGGCGYPLFVAGLYSIFGTGRELPLFLIQILLQGLAVWFVFQVASQLAGAGAAAIAAGFFTFHPVLIWLSIALMSEAILVPAVAGLLWLVLCRPVTPKISTAIGALLGGMALTRSTTAALVWMTIAWFLFLGRGRNWKSAAALLAIFLLVCAPWTIRNYAHWDRFIPFSTKSGVNAWFFNHPGLKVEFSRAAVEGPQPIDIYDPRIQSLPDEAARNDRLMAMFKEFAWEHPGKFIGLCWIRFWMALLPARITSTTSGALISAWYAKGIPLVVGLLFLALAFKGRVKVKPGFWFVFLVAAYWQAIQTLAGPGLRYRLPVEPAWAIMTGVAVVAIAGMLKSRKETPSAH
jgi:4-amino-4-deoxy-L-arabinose transferase-like glycosyltransferase